MIEVKDISFAYKGGERITFPSFSYPQGEQALIIGKSGCGKTTLLHLLAGLISPLDGQIDIAGTCTSHFSGSKMDRFRGNNIGVIFQKPHFVKALNVLENVLLAQNLSGNQKNLKHAQDLLNSLGLTHKLTAKVTDLSEGEKQRVSIARALVNNPQLILADEPTSALDDENCAAVIELLKRSSKEANSTLLIVTHDNRLKEHFSNKIAL